MTDAEVIEVVNNTLLDTLERENIDGAVHQVENVYIRFGGEMHKTIVSWILEPQRDFSFCADLIFKSIQSALGDGYIVKVLQNTISVYHKYYREQIPFKIQLFVYRKENS